MIKLLNIEHGGNKPKGVSLKQKGNSHLLERRENINEIRILSHVAFLFYSPTN